MNAILLRRICVLFFFALSFTSFAQNNTVVRYKPMNDLTMGKNDSLNLPVPDSVFYESTGAALTYEAFLLVNNAPTVLPAWLTFKTDPLSFGGRPLQASEGTFPIMMKATSGTFSATDTFKIQVINQAPVVSQPLSGLIFAQGFASAKVDLSKTFLDPDGDALTYTMTNSATGVVTASITASTITLTEVGVGSADITVTAKDGEGKTVTNTFTVIIRKIDEVFGFTTENTGSNGLVESWVRSIYVENNNEIWFGTDMGVSVYNPTQNTWTTSLKGGNRDDGKGKILKILKTSTGTKCLLVLRGFQLAGSTGYTYYDKTTIPELGDFVLSGAFDSTDKLWLVINKSNLLYLVRYNITTKQVELNQQLFSTIADSRNLVIDAQNTPWIATSKGLVHYQTSGTTVFNQANGLPADYVYNVAVKDGKVYFVQDGSIGIYDGTNFKKLSYDKLFNVRDNALTIDSKGDIWTSSLNYGVLHYNATTGWQALKLKFLGDTFAFDYSIYDINIDALNRLWVASRWGVVLYPTATFPLSDTPAVFNTYDGLPSNDVYRILKDDKGNAWFPTNSNGVSKYDGQNWIWTYRTVPFDAAIWLQNTTAAYVAKNGDIWLGGAGGLSTTSDGNTWKSFTSVDYGNANSVLNMNNVTAIAEDASKNIWVGGVGYTTNMGLNKYNGTTWSTYKVADGLKGTSFNSLFGDSKGNVWVAYSSVSPTTLTKIASNGTMTHYPTASTTPEFGSVQQMLETSDGKIWVATTSGIGVFDGTTWSTFKQTNGLLSNQVTQMAADGLGNIWIAYSPTLQLGVSMYDGTKWQNFNKQNGLPSDQINSLQILITSAGSTGGRTQATGGTLWLGTPTDGVSRLDIDGFLKPTTTTPTTPTTPDVTTEVISDKESVVVYPNPVDNVLMLKTNDTNTEVTMISIVDIAGRAWYSQQVSSESTIELPVDKLKAGVYIVQWKDNSGWQRKRFVKK